MKIKWGVIGCGGIADRRTLPGMMLADNAELVAVMDSNPEAAARCKEKYGAKIHFIKAEAIDMSSSMIRREIDNTSVATKNLPTAVYEFIKSRGLYNEQN